MSNEDDKTETLETQRDPYDAAVMQFLDQEITASSKPAPHPKTPMDDVEALVENLLKESMGAPETKSAEQDTGMEDLDRLFSRIFKENKPALHSEIGQALPAVESQLDEALREIGLVNRPSADIRVADLPFTQKPAAAVSMEMAPPDPAVSTQAPTIPAPPAPAVSTRKPVAPLSPVPVAPTVKTAPVPSPLVPKTVEKPEKHDTREQTEVAPVRDEFQKTLLFAASERKPFWNTRFLVIAGAFVCLLAGVGIVVITKYNHNEPAKSGQSTDSVARAADPVVTQPAVDNPAPSTAAADKSPVTRPAKGPGSPGPAAAANPGNTVSSVVPPKQGTPATMAPGAPAAAANAPVTATVNADAAGKSVSNAAAALENPVANPPQRSVEAPPPPPVVRTQTAPESALAPLIPKASTNLEDPATTKRPAFQPPTQPPTEPPVVPKRVTPAVVTSRVLPSYPELARKSRITGTVVVDVQVDVRGKVTKATAISGPAILRVEAENAVLRWQFRPANVEGIAVPSTSQVSIVFK